MLLDARKTLIIMDSETKSFRNFGAILWASQEKSVLNNEACACTTGNKLPLLTVVISIYNSWFQQQIKYYVDFMSSTWNFIIHNQKTFYFTDVQQQYNEQSN